MRQAIVPITFFVLSLAALPGHADDQDVIDYRQHIMKTMGEQAAALGQMMQKKVPADNFAAHLQILAETAALAKSAFTPKVVGGNAKAGIWENWADVSKRFDELVQVASDGAKAGKAQGVAAGMPKLTCKGCHDTYREEKK